MEGVDYLRDERDKAQFDVKALKVVWAGSRESFEVSDRMAKLVANDPEQLWRAIQNLWHMDSGRSRHMTGNLYLLQDFVLKRGGYVQFTGENGGHILGQGFVVS